MPIFLSQCRKLIQIVVIIINYQPMQILQIIQKECERITANPKNINSLNALISSLVQNQKISTSIRMQGLQKIIDVLHKFSMLSNELTKAAKLNQSTLKAFVQQKASIVSEIVFSLIKSSQEDVEQDNQKYFLNILAIFDKLNAICSNKFVQQFYTKIVSVGQKIKDVSNLYSLMTSSQTIIAITAKILQQSTKANDLPKALIQNCLNLLLQLPHFSQIIIASQQTAKLLKKIYQQCLLKFFQLMESHRQLAVSVYRKIGDKILSKLSNPLILSDYFLNKFQQDPQIQIEVLSCLFILVGKYNLQFQNFYEKLQKLIQSRAKSSQSQPFGKSIYQLPNSRRFFKLVESALRTSKVPFKTISSMCKIIIRQILQEQSQFTFWALSFFVNLTKKHRRLLDEIQNMPEIALLKKHYSPQIRALVGQLKKDLNKSEYLDIDQFAKVNMKKLTNKKLEEVAEKLNSEQDTQFRIPALWQDL